MPLQRTKPVVPDEEAQDDVPSTRITKEVEPPIKSGWARNQRPRSANATQIPRFSVPDDGEEILIKFIDAEPFAPIWQHWVAGEQGRRAYTCMGFNECPLCARGDRAKASDWFNIVVLGETPELKVWIASPDPSGAIQERAESKRYSPINKDGLYFAVSKKKGSNGFFSYSIDPVREDELEDWPGYRALSPAELAAFEKQKFDSSAVRIHTKSELEEAARKFVDEG